MGEKSGGLEQRRKATGNALRHAAMGCYISVSLQGAVRYTGLSWRLPKKASDDERRVGRDNGHQLASGYTRPSRALHKGLERPCCSALGGSQKWTRVDPRSYEHSQHCWR